MHNVFKQASLGAALSAICAVGFAAAPAGATVSASATPAPCNFIDSIVFGRTSTQTGVNKRKGLGSDAAIKALFDKENTLHCGVNGHKLELLSEDDGYDAKRAEAGARALLEKNVFAFLAPMNTAGTLAILPIVTGAGVPIVGSTSGNINVVNALFFPTRNKNIDDAKGITKHLSIIGDPSLAVVYQNDAFGKAALPEMNQAAEEDNIEITARVPMSATGEDVVAVLDQLMASGGARAHSIALLLIDGPSAAMVKEIRAKNYRQRIFTIGSSGEFEIGAGKEASYGVVVSQGNPALRDRSYTSTTEFSQLMAAKSPEYINSVAAFQGYMAARVAIEGLKGAGAKPTRESFVASLGKFKMREIGGLYYSYDTPEHVGTRYNELMIWGPDGKMAY